MRRRRPMTPAELEASARAMEATYARAHRACNWSGQVRFSLVR